LGGNYGHPRYLKPPLKNHFLQRNWGIIKPGNPQKHLGKFSPKKVKAKTPTSKKFLGPSPEIPL